MDVEIVVTKGNSKAVEGQLLQINMETYPNRRESAEEIILYEDDSEEEVVPTSSDNQNHSKERRKVVIDWECVNTECRITGSKSRSTVNGGRMPVKTASSYVIAYYGQVAKENSTRNEQGSKHIVKKRKVCFSCERKANEAQDKMFEDLVNGESILKEKLFPTPKDVVLIEDSDEEPISDTSSESEVIHRTFILHNL